MYSVDERKVSRRRGAFATYYVKRAANRRHVQSSRLTRSRDTRDRVRVTASRIPRGDVARERRENRRKCKPAGRRAARRSLINALADRVSI